MQSINASEIRMRNQLREELGRKVNDFLKSGTITNVGTTAYRQIGNGVSVPVGRWVGSEMNRYMS